MDFVSRQRAKVVWIVVVSLAAVVAPALPPQESAAASVFTPNIFGVVQQAPPDPTDTRGERTLPAQIESIEIYRVSVSGSSPNTQMVRTLIASDTGNVGDDDSVIIDDTAFTAFVDFQSPFTYEMVVTPVDEDAGGVTTFRLPGPAGDAGTRMAFRLEDEGNPGLYAKVFQWACRADNDVNCVDTMRAWATSAPGSKVVVDDSDTFPTYDCTLPCGVQPDGSYGQWGQYQTWNIPSVGSNPAQQVRVQFVYRPVERGPNRPPDPQENPYPYITIEVYTQGNDYTRDGWGCYSAGQNNTWWAPGESWDDTPYPTWLTQVEATQPCGGGAPIDPDLTYELTLKTAQSTFTPLFTAGYLTNLSSSLSFDADDTAYRMTVSGAPRAWQWLGGDWRNGESIPSDDSTSYANYYDGTNLDWSYSTYDGRTIASQGQPSLTPCIGVGMAVTSTNGNGGYIPTWDLETQSLRYNTDGRHFMPSNIDDSGNPSAPTSAGLVYIGKAEIVIPTPLAICMWSDAGFTSVARLRKLAGQVRAENNRLKTGATVNLTVDDTAVRVDAAGYTYSSANLVVAPGVGVVPFAGNAGSVTVGDEGYAEFVVRNNDDSYSYTFSSAPSMVGGDDFFPVRSDQACYDDSVTLLPGEECRIAFVFVPESVGQQDDTLTFSTTSASSDLTGLQEISIQGTGVAAPVPPQPDPSFPPGAPSTVKATASDASATVAWAPPASSGSFPVTEYQVLGSPSGQCVTTASRPTCEVTGLRNGTEYTFTVRALNGAGWGPYSDSSNAVTPRDPNPPVTPAIMITGSRGDVRGKTGVIITGTTEGMGMGAILRPWTRFPGQTSYTEGSADILVSADGNFTWQRRSPRKMYITVRTVDGSVVSNRVIVPAS